MKVICINNKPLPGRFNSHAPNMLKEGVVYNVIDTNTSGELGPAYELSETKGYLFCCSRFTPLSDIDETTFERDYNKELQPK